MYVLLKYEKYFSFVLCNKIVFIVFDKWKCCDFLFSSTENDQWQRLTDEINKEVFFGGSVEPGNLWQLCNALLTHPLGKNKSVMRPLWHLTRFGNTYNASVFNRGPSGRCSFCQTSGQTCTCWPCSSYGTKQSHWINIQASNSLLCNITENNDLDDSY